MTAKATRQLGSAVLLLLLSSIGSPKSSTFDDALLHYRVDYAHGKPAAISVSLKETDNEECATAAFLTAENEINKKWPLGPEIGKDNVAVIPTSGKRRDTINFENAVATLSVFSNRAGKCELFDRATFFYRLHIRGKISALQASLIDIGSFSIKRYLVSIRNQEFQVDQKDFEKLREGETVELEYLSQKGLPARLINTQR